MTAVELEKELLHEQVLRKQGDRPLQGGRLMVADPLEELRRLLRHLFEAWDAWIDSDQWAGPEYDSLAAAIEALRRRVEQDSA